MTELENQKSAPGRPESPIKSTNDDALGREGFVRRLVSALINARTGKATGVVVGITGPWGSGKSSVLNLVNERIKKDHGDAVVVRFDPWLVSGRNDLISAFLAELLGTISTEPKLLKKLRTVARTVTKYGQQLAPAIPGVGAAIGSGLGALGTGIEAAESLSALRARLFRELKQASVPIVVLIDEIDRVDDDEVRTVAQLVRAVADFPGVSYLLAYDPDRVAQALGAGAPVGQEQSRGRAYLEKIVQLQIPLPLTLDEELVRLVAAELEKLSLELELPPSFSTIKRYQELLQMVCGDSVATPRDVGRLVGTYHALAGMLAGEVDWLDLLAYSILLIKAPGIVTAIRRDPWAFTGDIVRIRDVARQMEFAKFTAVDRLKKLLPDNENTEANRNIVGFLFPTYSDIATKRYGAEHPDALSSRRPLMTTLRLGLLPGAYPRADIQRFVRGTTAEVAEKLKASYADDTIGELADRFDELYPDTDGVDHVALWKGIAEFARKPDCEWMSSYQPIHEVIRNLASVLERAVRRDDGTFVTVAQKIFSNLRSANEDVLTAIWVRSHIFAFGLFGNRKAGGERHPFLTVEETRAVALDMSQALRPAHLSGQLLPCRWELGPIYTMIDTGIWDDVCRTKTDEALEDPLAVDGITLMLYGNSFVTGRDWIAKFCSLERYLDRVRRRLKVDGDNRPHETVVVALKKAASGDW